MRSIFFKYPISEIQEEVDNRSSRVAMARGKENDNPELFDDLRLTSGESFVFNELLEKAVYDTYDWIQAFCRHVKDGVRITHDVARHSVYKNFVSFKFNGKSSTASKDQLPMSILDYSQSYDSATNTVNVSFDVDYIDFPIDGFSGFVVCVHYVMYDSISGALMPINVKRNFMHNHSNTSSGEITYGVDNVVHSFSPNLRNLIQGKDDYRFGSVTSLEVTTIRDTKIGAAHLIEEGDMVEYYDENGNKSVYEAKCDTTDVNFNPAEHTQLDSLISENEIVFHLEAPDWWDENKKSSVKRYLKEAIINYILGKWYDTHFPSEADGFKTEAEEAGHNAQLSMNAEGTHLRRKTSWL